MTSSSTMNSTTTSITTSMMAPNSTPPCNYFQSGFTPNPPADACAIGVLATAGAVIVIALLLVCCGILSCCLRKGCRRAVQRTKPLAATQAASWFTSSLTSKLQLVTVIITSVLKLLALICQCRVLQQRVCIFKKTVFY